MQPDVKTLFIVCAHRGSSQVLDLVESIRWSCQDSSFTLLVDECACLQLPGDGETYATLAMSNGSDDMHRGFRQLAAIYFAVNRGWQFERVVMLSDDSLLIGRGFDAWLAKAMSENTAGLLGVEDRLNYEDAFPTISQLLSEWAVPHEHWEAPPSPKTVQPACYALSRALVDKLYERRLLPPEGYNRWPLGFGCYLSWVAQMLEFYQALWGHMDRAKPPLYVNYHHGRYLPAPQILSPAFLLFHSLRGVTGYTESELRDGYRQFRQTN